VIPVKQTGASLSLSPAQELSAPSPERSEPGDVLIACPATIPVITIQSGKAIRHVAIGPLSGFQRSIHINGFAVSSLGLKGSSEQIS
jgi:hypothetical protein